MVHSSHLDWLPSSTIEITDTEGFIRNLTELYRCNLVNCNDCIPGIAVAKCCNVALVS